MIHASYSLVVLAIVFCSAMSGMLVSRILPQNHLSDQTRSVVTVSMGVVGTLTAMVLGLLVAAASSSFNTKNQEVILLAAGVIKTDRVLLHYGPDAEGLRDLLRRYAAMKTQDLFPEGTTKQPILANSSTNALLEELLAKVVAFDASNPTQRWLQSRALQHLTDIGEARWLLVEQNTIGLAFPLMVVVVFWLSLTFLSFGVFAPRNATAILALFLCALAVAAAIEVTQDLNAPFQGMIRISSQPMKEALDQISAK